MPKRYRPLPRDANEPFTMLTGTPDELALAQTESPGGNERPGATPESLDRAFIRPRQNSRGVFCSSNSPGSGN